METNTLPLYLITWCLIAFVGAIYFQLKKTSSLTIFHSVIIIGILVSTLVVTYFTDSEVYGKNFNRANFGQMGDFFGGILNPIFGFITILLLLNQASIMKHEKLQESNIRNMESLYKLLEKAKQRFNARIAAIEMMDESKQSIEFFSFASVFFSNTLLSIHRKKIVGDALNSIRHASSISEIQNFNEWVVFLIRADIKHVIKHYKKMIEIEDFEYAREDIANQFEEFMNETDRYFLLTTNEYTEIKEIISKHVTQLFK